MQGSSSQAHGSQGDAWEWLCCADPRPSSPSCLWRVSSTCCRREDGKQSWARLVLPLGTHWGMGEEAGITLSFWSDPQCPCFLCSVQGGQQTQRCSGSLWFCVTEGFLGWTRPGSFGISLMQVQWSRWHAAEPCFLPDGCSLTPRPAPSQLGAALSPACTIGAPRARSRPLGPYFTSGKADADHMAASRPAARSVGLCLFIYFNLWLTWGNIWMPAAPPRKVLFIFGSPEQSQPALDCSQPGSGMRALLACPCITWHWRCRTERGPAVCSSPAYVARSFPLCSWLLSSEGWGRGRASSHLKAARRHTGPYRGGIAKKNVTAWVGWWLYIHRWFCRAHLHSMCSAQSP